MSKEKHLVVIGLQKDEIVIRCKVKDLIFITENDPKYKFKIIDENEFAKQVVFQLQNMESRMESGMNIVEAAFEKAYIGVYEDGNECIVDLDNPIT